MFRTLTAAALLCTASPLLAQSNSGSELPDPNDRSNNFTIAAGVGSVPDYEGSDEQKLIPAVAIRGRVSGISFWTAGTALYVDLLARPESGIDFDLGPIVGVSLNRSSDVKDAAVDKLPELDMAFEVGAFAGVSFHGLTNPYDALSFHVDVTTDVSDAHGSTLITPTLDFGTPLSTTTYVGVSASAEWAGGGYADYYYSIGPEGSLASGLPQFDADGGFKHWRLSLFANQSISGDLLNGWSIFGIGLYTKLSGDFADSPIVDDRGSSSQWFGGLGVAYTW